MLKLAAFLAFLLVAVLVAYSLVSPQQKVIVDKQDAINFVLNDLKPFTDGGADVRVVSAMNSSIPGQWSISVLVAQNPHSYCPTLFRRDYSLLPFGFRTEQVITDCNPHNPIYYREEAIIDSGKLTEIAGMQGNACAFQVKDYSLNEARKYCGFFDEQSYNSFKGGLGDRDWVVEWNSAQQTKFVALSEDGSVVKTG